MDRSIGTLERADVLIEGARIREVARGIAADDCELIDGSAMIAIPGLVDAHRHLWTTPLRGVAADYTLFDYITKMMMVSDPLFRPEDVYVGTYAGALEALESGVTSLVAHGDCIGSPEHADEMIRALEESRLRTVFCYGMAGQGNFEPGKPLDLTGAIPSPEWHFEDARRVRETRLSSDEDLVTFGIAMNELEGFPLELSQREIEFARELGAHVIGLDAAMGPMSGDAKYVLQLANAGLLGPDMLIIHGPSLTDEELDRIAEAGAAVAVAPENELQTGCGFPVAGRALARGARASLGIDTVAGYRGDLFTQMRFALQAERARQSEVLAREGLAPRKNKIAAREMLELVTLGGARAVGLDAKVGSLTPGKQADVVLIRSDRLGLAPVNDPVNTVVVQANAADVDSVFVAGEPVKRGGRLLNVDVPRVLERLEASRDHLAAAMSQVDLAALEEMAAPMFPLG
jgi:cytosine/adenosine deaminase-related metal-dependent hydrolase